MAASGLGLQALAWRSVAEERLKLGRTAEQSALAAAVEDLDAHRRVYAVAAG